jgi:hypothetical protein
MVRLSPYFPKSHGKPQVKRAGYTGGIRFGERSQGGLLSIL